MTARHHKALHVVKGTVGPHPVLPRLSSHDLVLRHDDRAWHVEHATGQPMCEPVTSLAEARLIGRTFVEAAGRVWVCEGGLWAVLDKD